MDNIASIDICPDFSIYLTWGPGKYVTWRMPTILIMKFQVIYTAPVTELCHFWCRNVAWSFDLDLRSFYLGDSMIISCRVVNSTTPSNSGIPCDHPLSSFDGFQADHVRRITWPVKMGSETAAYLESPTLICPLSVQHLQCMSDQWWSIVVHYGPQYLYNL